MLKIGAGFILTSIIVPLLVWGSTSIITQGQEIARLQEKEKTTTSLLMEVRSDVKELLKRGRK